MRIGILGAGSVGGTLGRRWCEAGHEVRFGVRNPRAEKVQELLGRCGERATAGPVEETGAASDALVVAVPWEAAALALREAGDVHGKPVLDCTNPLLEDLSALALGFTTSGAEVLAAAVPDARLVKIFNTTGWQNLADPDYGGEPVTMLYCGDFPDAKRVAADLARDLGFAPLDAGGLQQARLLEPLALLWIQLALFQKEGSDFAFQVRHRS